MKTFLKVLFLSTLCCAFMLGVATGFGCIRCFTGPEQTVSDTHAEPDCAWAQMHACTKARWQIGCSDWVEVSVTNTPCTTLPNGNKQSTCTIVYKCIECIDLCM